MPRQTDQKAIQFPDGFKMEMWDGSAYQDVGVLAGGATATFNWDEFYLDGGNYEGLVDRAINPTVALAPSAVLNWNPERIAELFPGFFKVDTTATSPAAGSDIEYNGTERHVELTRRKIRLTHYTVNVETEDEGDADIDWQFTLNHAKIDAGGQFNFKGVNEDGLDEITVSFTGKPDPADTYKLFTFFKAD